jgi:hypothetical protein
VRPRDLISIFLATVSVSQLELQVLLCSQHLFLLYMCNFSACKQQRLFFFLSWNVFNSPRFDVAMNMSLLGMPLIKSSHGNFFPRRNALWYLMFLLTTPQSGFKGTVSRDFLLQDFFMNHLPQELRISPHRKTSKWP